MADNNVNVIQDQDFYGAIRFFGSVVIKTTGSFLMNGTITASGLTINGNIVASGNIQAVNVTASGNLVGITKRYAETALSDPPSSQELTAILGNADEHRGVIRMIYDTANGITYLCVSEGTAWTYVALSIALEV